VLAGFAGGCGGAERFGSQISSGSGGDAGDATNGGTGGAFGSASGGTGGDGSGGDTGGAGGTGGDVGSGSGGQGGGSVGSGGAGGDAGSMGASGGSGVAGAVGSGGASGSGGTSGSGGAGGSVSGGSGGQGGKAGPPDARVVTGACAGKVHTLGAADALIANLEDSSLTAWYEYRDPTPGATMNPIAIVMPGAAGTARGARLSGQGFQSYGGGMGIRILCTDASFFQGIAFWAKGTSGSDNKISLQVAIPQSQAVADGGDCTASCYDHPLKQVQLGANWQRYQIAFSDLAQSGFGAPATFQGIIMALNWASLSGPNLDYSVDEITFY
jgi:hypothetical protein